MREHISELLGGRGRTLRKVVVLKQVQLRIQLAPSIRVGACISYPPPHPANSNKSRTHVSARNLCASTLKTDSLAAATEINLQRFISARHCCCKWKSQTLSPFGGWIKRDASISLKQHLAQLPAQYQDKYFSSWFNCIGLYLEIHPDWWCCAAFAQLLAHWQKLNISLLNINFALPVSFLLVSVAMSLPRCLPSEENFSAELHQSTKMIRGSKK